MSRNQHIPRHQVLLPVIVTTVLLLSSPAFANWHFGNVGFWDSRDRSDITGSFLHSCDETDAWCFGGSTNCCYSLLGRTTVQLWEPVNNECDVWPLVDLLGEAEADQNGYFDIELTPDHDDDVCVRVEYDNDDVDLPMTLEWDDGGGFDTYWDGADLVETYLLPNGNVWHIMASVTHHQGSGTDARAAMAWQTALDTFAAFRSDGETRMDNGNRLTIELLNFSEGGNPGANRIKIGSLGNIRSWVTAHETGHLLTRRAVGAYYPTQNQYGVAHNWGRRALEEASVGEGWAYMVRLFAQYDPDVVDFLEMVRDLEDDPSADIFAHCADTSSFDWTNDVAVDRNVAMGLWEFMDADTTNGDDFEDSADFRIVDLMDADVAWYNNVGTQGQNRTRSEHWLDDAVCPVPPVGTPPIVVNSTLTVTRIISAYGFLGADNAVTAMSRARTCVIGSTT